MPKTPSTHEALFSPSEIRSFRFSWRGRPLWVHWKAFADTWALSLKSPKTVSNVYHCLRIVMPRGRLFTADDWLDGDGAFSTLHALREERRWSPVTFNSYRKNANTYFAFLLRRGLIEANPVRRIDKMREKQRNYPLPSKEDFARIAYCLRTRRCVNPLERKRNQLFFVLLAETGARPQELLSLTLTSVRDRKHVEIEGAKTGGKPRKYALSVIGAELLRDYVREAADAGRDRELEGRLFLSVRSAAPWSYCGVRKFFERLNREAGTEVRVTCYSFRRNAATRLFLNGLSIEQIMKFLGHSEPATTMRYVQNLPEINAEASKVLMREYNAHMVF